MLHKNKKPSSVNLWHIAHTSFSNVALLPLSTSLTFILGDL